ncbi:hypothetical protein HYT25_04075 [Candidatus Pacearchaeota archaeon]|nr:hypothetical protein [Candidatus Pacearchaeota archaeon]
MVKLEGLAEEEVRKIRADEKWKEGRLKDIKKQKEFVRITRNIVGGSRMIMASTTSYGPDGLSNDGPYPDFCREIFIKGHLFSFGKIKITTHYEGFIYVKDPKYLDEALRLAQAYEKAEFGRFGNFGEFIIKKEYEE